MRDNKKRSGIVGFTCGSFDLTHAGHYLMFKECRSKCDYLIVGLQRDPSVDRPWKNKPVQTLRERYIQIASCKYINKIIPYRAENDLQKLLKKLKPDIRFIGLDWKGKQFTGKNLPIKIVFNSRNHKYSSSMLRRRILKSSESKN